MNSHQPSGRSGVLGEDDAVPVRNHRKIERLLTDLKEQHVLVTVALPDTNEVYNSALLAVDPKQGRITLDELTPAGGHERLLRAGELMVYARLAGLSLRFSSTLLEHSREDGIALYRLRLPELVYHGQKRSYYRVRVGLGSKVPVTLAHDESVAINGELRDLSLGGIGAAFPLGTGIAQGEQLESCWIDLPGGGALSCALEIRYASPDEPHHELRVGAQFVELTPAQERQLQRCINDLEREQIRRQPRGPFS